MLVGVCFSHRVLPVSYRPGADVVIEHRKVPGRYSAFEETTAE
jgi:hypothetical protein